MHGLSLRPVRYPSLLHAHTHATLRNTKKNQKRAGKKKGFSAQRFSLDDFVYIQGISCYKEKARSYEPFYSLFSAKSGRGSEGFWFSIVDK